MAIRAASDFDRLWISAGKKVKEKAYWLEKLSGEWTKSSFHHSSFINLNGTGIGEANFRLDGDLYSELIRLSSGSDVRLHIILTTVLTFLLSMYSGNDDITIGTPVLKKTTTNENENERINHVVVLRNRVHGEASFKELLLQVRRTVSEAFENRNYPIEILIRQLDLPASETGFPLFDTAIALEPIQEAHDLSDIETGVNFFFSKKEEGDGFLEGKTLVDARFFSPAAIERITGHFHRIVEMVLSNIDIKLSEIDFLFPGEREQLLYTFNHTQTDYPKDKTIPELFDEQVEKTPDHLALIGSTTPGALREAPLGLTYKELNERSAHLACALREKGVGPDIIVGIRIGRSIEMIVGLFGILKAGGAYLPIDPDFPQERIDYMLTDSGASNLITD
ncbi:MAG: AMP-binding protein, partial [Candidatus Omnitrophota bacterium]